jgi:hypothetical protein
MKEMKRVQNLRISILGLALATFVSACGTTTKETTTYVPTARRLRWSCRLRSKLLFQCRQPRLPVPPTTVRALHPIHLRTQALTTHRAAIIASQRQRLRVTSHQSQSLKVRSPFRKGRLRAGIKLIKRKSVYDQTAFSRELYEACSDKCRGSYIGGNSYACQSGSGRRG